MAEDGGRVPMSPGLQATLLRAREYAASQSEAQVLLEHLLLALSEDADAATVLESCQVDLSRLRHDVAGYIGSLDDRVPPGTPGAPAISPALTQVLKYATLAAQQGRRTSIDGAIVLAALVGDGRSMGASFLKAQGLTFEAAIRALREVASRPGALQPEPPRVSRSAEPVPPESGPELAAAQPPTSRADEILARARERVESRSSRTDPGGRAPRADRGGPVEPAPEPRPPAPPHETPVEAAVLAAPIVPSEPAPPREAPPQSPPGRDAAAAAAAAAPPSGPPQRDTPADAGPPLPDLAPLPSPAQQAPPPRPVPPQRPRPGLSSEQPRNVEFNGAHQPPANRPFAQRHDGTQPDTSVSRAQPPTPGGWAAARQLQAGGGQHLGPSEVDASGSRAMRSPAGRILPPEPPPSSQPPAFEPAPPPQSYVPDAEGAPRVPAIDSSLVSHTIPARLKQGRVQVVEVRIERPPLAAAGGPSRAYALRPEAVVARAIAVRLRPVAGRFIVEAGSPETQWDQGGTAAGGGRFSSDAAVWRFNVTPLRAGKGALQVAVSARTLGADGVLAETQLPEQTFAVRIARGYGGMLARAGLVVGVAVGSVLFLKLVEAVLGFDLYFFLKQLLRF